MQQLSFFDFCDGKLSQAATAQLWYGVGVRERAENPSEKKCF